MGTTKGRGLRGGVAPQPRRKEGYLDLDRGGGASGVQVWEGRLLWNESRVGQCLLTSRSGEIAGGPKYLAVPACAPATGGEF